MTAFKTHGIQPFGVNPADVENHARYVAKMGFPFPLLSDPDRAIATAYHALKDDGRGIQRSVYVVARDGTIYVAGKVRTKKFSRSSHSRPRLAQSPPTSSVSPKSRG